MMDGSVLLLLGLVGFVAGLIDAVAGGGGLLALPALLTAGLDPVAALATNKLQGSFGTGSAVVAFARRGFIDFGKSWAMIGATFLASALGVLAVTYLPTAWLSAVMPLMLIALALYFAVSPKLGNEDAKPRITDAKFAATAAPAIGFYDGIFGPGAGSFYLVSFVTLLGQGIVKATASTKLLNFTSNIAALLVFALSGKVIWLVGLVMALGQILGAQLGSHLAVKNGAKIIRPLLVVVCCAMAIRLIMRSDNPLWAMLR
jgi:uncharacterized protein